MSLLGTAASAATGGLPMDVLTFGVSAIGGAIAKMVAAKRKAQEFREHLAEMRGKFNSDMANAAYNRTKSSAIMQHVLAITAVMAIGSVTVVPVLASLFHIPVVVSWNEVHHGLLFFPDQVTRHFQMASGLYIGPAQVNLAAAAGGYIFGTQIRSDV